MLGFFLLHMFGNISVTEEKGAFVTDFSLNCLLSPIVFGLN